MEIQQLTTSNQFLSKTTGVLLATTLALVCSASSMAQSSETIILDLANNYTDEVEDAIMSQAENEFAGFGPIVAAGLEFACGTGVDADFTATSDYLGIMEDGVNFVGVCPLAAETIITENIKWTAVLESGSRYEIEFLTWADAVAGWPACYDRDGGAACGLTFGHTSYIRTVVEVEEPTNDLACTGFLAPMDVYPASAPRRSAYPLNFNLYDAGGFEVTNTELAAPPVLQVVFMSEVSGVATDIGRDSVRFWRASRGNQFNYGRNGQWQHNLRGWDYSAPGEYVVTAVSGDAAEYTIEPTCITSFIVE